jgi:hypothetical protein
MKLSYSAQKGKIKVEPLNYKKSSKVLILKRLKPFFIEKNCVKGTPCDDFED